MPTVSQYGRSRVTTQIANQPRAQGAPAGAFDGGISNSLNNVAAAANQIKERIDTTAAEEALTAFEKQKNDILFNPESGYFNTQGKNAFDGVQSTNEALTAAREQFANGLDSTAARERFNAVSSQHIARSTQDINRHASSGLKAWESATIQAQVENSLESAALSFNDPEALRLNNAIGRQSIIEKNNIDGSGPEALIEELQTYNSEFARTTILAATAQSAAQGQALFDKMSSDLEGPYRNKIEGQIQQKLGQEKNQRDAAVAINKSQILVDKYDDRQSIIDEVNTIEDPILRKKTLSESMAQFSRKRQAQKEAAGDAFEEAESHIVDGGSVESFKANNPVGWDRLNSKQKRSLESGKATVTDWNTYNDLVTLPQSKLSNVNPSDHFADLAPSERKSLINAVKSARGQSNGKGKAESQVGRTRASEVNANLEIMIGGKKSSWNNDKKVIANEFQTFLTSEVLAREEAKGAPLSSAEFTKTINDLSRKHVVESKYLLLPDSDVEFEDFDDDKRNQYAEFLRDRGLEVSIKNLTEARKQNVLGL